VTHFILGMAAGVFICTAVYGYLVLKIYRLLKYGLNP